MDQMVTESNLKEGASASGWNSQFQLAYSIPLLGIVLDFAHATPNFLASARGRLASQPIDSRWSLGCACELIRALVLLRWITQDKSCCFCCRYNHDDNKNDDEPISMTASLLLAQCRGKCQLERELERELKRERGPKEQPTWRDQI